MSIRCSRLIIDKNALLANYRYLQQQCAVPVHAVIKGDGYGIGAKILAPWLQQAGCHTFFTATLEEAIALRALPALNDCRIAVLNGPHQNEGEYYKQHQLTPILNSLEQMTCFRDYAKTLDTPYPVFIHYDSGINRLGLREIEMDTLINAPDCYANLNISAMLSHLASGDNVDDPANALQLKNLEQMKQRLPDVPVIFANSAGVFLGAAYHQDGVKPGAALYGFFRNLFPELQHVVTLKAPILQITELKKGERSGYDLTYIAEEDCRIAIAAHGYADGYLRYDEKNRKRQPRYGVIGGVRAPLLGRVSMDLTIFDISQASKQQTIETGDDITLMGEDYDITQFAQDCGTIPYEVLTLIGKRVKREIETNQSRDR